MAPMVPQKRPKEGLNKEEQRDTESDVGTSVFHVFKTLLSVFTIIVIGGHDFSDIVFSRT